MRLMCVHKEVCIVTTAACLCLDKVGDGTFLISTPQARVTAYSLPLLPMSWRRRTENSQGLYSLLFLNGGVDGIDDFFPWNQDFANVFFHLRNEVGLMGAA